MTEGSAQIAKGGAAAISTLAGGVYLLYAQTIVGMIGVIVGAIYTAVLTKKLLIELDLKKHTCRRCADKEEHESK